MAALRAAAEDLETITRCKFYTNPTPIVEKKVRGSCYTQGFADIGNHSLESCMYAKGHTFIHFEHAGMETIEDMTKQGVERDGFIISLLVGIGNKLSDYILWYRINLKSLFNKLDAIAKVLLALPTKEEYAEERKDDKQILELLKLIARKQGMSPKQIEDLRPEEYVAPKDDDIKDIPEV